MQLTKLWLQKLCLALCLLLLLTPSCKKEPQAEEPLHPEQTNTIPGDVAVDWFSFNIRLFRNNNFITNFLLSRYWQYSSVAVYEAVVPGMPSYQSLSGQLNEMPTIPKTERGASYHWGVAANTVFAAMTRYYYSSLPAADKTSTDSLETAYNNRFAAGIDAATLKRSIDFGKAVAEAIYQWSLTDNFSKTYTTYVPPTGPGLWVPTPPAFLPAGIPYTGEQRPMIKGCIEATQPAPPPSYSTTPGSLYYNMQKEVYDASKSLTADQKEQAIFWRDQPGTGAFGHWFTIMTQVFREQSSINLDKVAITYAKMGITQAESRISCWKSKYAHNMLRPVTYIRNVLNDPTWNSFIVTPNNPDFPSAAASFSAVAAGVLSGEFGNVYRFIDTTYNFLNLPPRTYNSFEHAADEAAQSRLYAGIHVRPSTDAGLWQGYAIVRYMENNIRFKK